LVMIASDRVMIN